MSDAVLNPTTVTLILRGLVWMMLFVLLPCAIGYLIYFLLSLPLRRQERARFLLELLEQRIRAGDNAEQAVVAIAESRDRSMPARFYLLAAHLENGLRLGEALDKVPYLLPSKVAAMLRAGQEIGAIEKVLPACRKCLADGASQVWGAMNYLVVLLLGFVPAYITIFTTLNVFVLPKFQVITAELEIRNNVFSLLQIYGPWFNAMVGGVYLLILAGAVAYCAGPRLWAWLEGGLFPFSGRIFYWLPWQRKRMVRDFSAMLAVLLDAGVPEGKAVSLAGEATANSVFRKRAEAVATDLAAGRKLTDALRSMDDTGEFRWRVRQASHSRGGFLQALNGWLEALDAKAFQQEQAAAQTLTSGLVLLNGLMVGIITVNVFQTMVLIIHEGVLW